MTPKKPICSLSVDLDNQWSYMKTHGDAGWQELPSYLDVVVPRILDTLDRFGWKITFFIVGQDAALARNREALKAIAAAGHEIGNHSFSHEPWLHLYTKQQIVDEICRAEDAIEAVTGVRPRGFRGPGYSLSRATLEVLADRGYTYDASTFPTYLGPLARAYYFRGARHLTTEQRHERKSLYGSFGDGQQTLQPYRWDLGTEKLLEIPVTTMPVLRLPFHFSYLLYIATFSPVVARLYFRTGLSSCRLAGIEPSLLLHPLDYLGIEDAPELAFFPAMELAMSRKSGILESLLTDLDRGHEVVSMGGHAARLQRSPNLRIRRPSAGASHEVRTSREAH